MDNSGYRIFIFYTDSPTIYAAQAMVYVSIILNHVIILLSQRSFFVIWTLSNVIFSDVGIYGNEFVCILLLLFL